MVSLRLGSLCAGLLTVSAALSLPTAGRADEKADLKALIEAQNKQMEQQRQQLDELKRRLDAMGERLATFTTKEGTLAPEKPEPKAVDADGVKKIVGDYLKEQDKKKKDDDDKKKKEAAEKGYEVGSDLKMSATWNNGLILQTENKDFRIHIGGRLNHDSVWFKQPRDLEGLPAPGGNLGVTNSYGLGPLDDGSFFRRVRVQLDGNAYEIMEFACETNFENINSIAFDDMWVGLKELPILGTVRFGQHKVPQGLESFSSSRTLVASERSSLFEAFWQEFGAGVYVSNTALDQHLTWHAMIGHRPEIAVPNSGDQFGDGDYAHTARVTLLPVWEQDGRYLLHLGASAQYRSATQDRDTGLPGTPVASPILPGTPGQRIPRDSSGNVVRFRDRPELRAAAGGLGNNGRFVDTGNIIADGVWTTAGELLAYWGPLHFQAEATWARTINAIYPTAPQPGTAPAFTTSGLPRGNLNYWGVYGQAGYFLTGENRGYDRRLGRYAGVKPNENFFCVKGEDDGVHSGSGAWELIYRYSFIDLNDKNVNGGLLGEHTVGVNWYLNPNFKIQLNALAINRDVKNSLGGFNVPANAGIANVNVPNPTLTPVSGTIYGLGLRFHLDF